MFGFWSANSGVSEAGFTEAILAVAGGADKSQAFRMNQQQSHSNAPAPGTYVISNPYPLRSAIWILLLTGVLCFAPVRPKDRRCYWIGQAFSGIIWRRMRIAKHSDYALR
jgi:hypothetical protein